MNPATPVPKFTYIPAVFHGGTPPILPPCQDLLPWEEEEKEKERLKAKLHADEQRHKENQALRKKKGGWMSTLTSVTSAVAHTVSGEVQAAGSLAKQAYGSGMNRWTASRFKEHFPHLAGKEKEKPLCEYEGNCVSAGNIVKGSVFVTDRNVCFTGIYNDTKSVPGQVLKHRISATIPLAAICSIQHASTIPSKDPLQPPQINYVAPGTNVTPDALQLYTVDGRLHLLYAFSRRQQLYNVIDHCWRRVCPSPPVYIPPQQQHQQHQQLVYQTQQQQDVAPVAESAVSMSVSDNNNNNNNNQAVEQHAFPSAPSAPPMDASMAPSAPTAPPQQQHQVTGGGMYPSLAQ